LAVKVTGEANQNIANKDQVMMQSKQIEQQESMSSDAARRPKSLAVVPMDTPMSQINCDNTGSQPLYSL